ncbi:MAG: L-glutamate gamma-semialdehyde dehydrogenase [Acidobacteria bacterium]|nr:L-glutamate gamma-semialdehyde dehydrogenase [Acidobacteriota bacterium]
MEPYAFANEPFVDFSKDENRNKMQEALSHVASKLGRTYPLIIDGKKIERKETFASRNPAKKSQVIGHFAAGTREDVETALAAAWKAFETWQHVAPEDRASVLFRCASILRRRKFEMSAWMVHEVGKPWAEADADTAEAIDFCEFYAREALRLAGKHPLTRVPHERNELRYIPLGAGAAIPPWNFPLAIMAGMTVAAVVTGNTIVMKPSSDAPAIAYAFMEVLEEAGLPPGVVNFLSGAGATVGDPLIDHPRTRFVAFTGSKEVGLRINERAAKPNPGQIWIKRVIVEMGGKDAILVADDADVDEAARGIVASAFGYSGQKCSACSRAIVDAKVYDAVLEKVAAGTRAITVGDPTDPKTQMGPVINDRAQATILGYVEAGKREGRLVTGGEAGSPDGSFVQPTVIADVPARGKIAQEEIFGPVLAVIKAKDFEDGLRIANDTEFGLTGAVYTRSPERIADAKRRFHVGNLYVNRKCTGAMVGVHPFGGFNMSGTDSKAGGHDYLLLFTQAKAISEKV